MFQVALVRLELLNQRDTRRSHLVALSDIFRDVGKARAKLADRLVTNLHKFFEEGVVLFGIVLIGVVFTTVRRAIARIGVIEPIPLPEGDKAKGEAKCKKVPRRHVRETKWSVPELFDGGGIGLLVANRRSCIAKMRCEEMEQRDTN